MARGQGVGEGDARPGLFMECTPPNNFAQRVAALRELTGKRQLLVIIDSLQKLPGEPGEDRRTTIDKWIRLLERLRHGCDVVFLVISEVRRGKDGYVAREDAFKESGGIEYASDLAMTLNRPAADEDTEAPATLRIELARDCDEDPRGEVASYRPVRPWYGLEEIDPVAIKKSRGSKRRGPPPEKAEAARDLLTDLLAGGPVAKEEAVRRAKEAGTGRTVVYDAAKALGLADCTVEGKAGWRMP